MGMKKEICVEIMNSAMIIDCNSEYLQDIVYIVESITKQYDISVSSDSVCIYARKDTRYNILMKLLSNFEVILER